VIETSRRLSITSDGLIPGMRRGRALITLATQLAALGNARGKTDAQHTDRHTGIALTPAALVTKSACI
jgi:hypothetical protein